MEFYGENEGEPLPGHTVRCPDCLRWFRMEDINRVQDCRISLCTFKNWVVKNYDVDFDVQEVRDE